MLRKRTVAAIVAALAMLEALSQTGTQLPFVRFHNQMVPRSGRCTMADGRWATIAIDYDESTGLPVSSTTSGELSAMFDNIAAVGLLPVSDGLIGCDIGYDVDGKVKMYKKENVVGCDFAYTDPYAPECITGVERTRYNHDGEGKHDTKIMLSYSRRNEKGQVIAWEMCEDGEAYYRITSDNDDFPYTSLTVDAGDEGTARIYDIVWDRCDNPDLLGTYSLGHIFPVDEEGMLTINYFCLGANRIKSAKAEYEYTEDKTGNKRKMNICLDVTYTPDSDNYLAKFTVDGIVVKECGYNVTDPATGSYHMYSDDSDDMDDGSDGPYNNPAYSFSIGFNSHGDVVSAQSEGTVTDYDISYNNDGAIYKVVCTATDYCGAKNITTYEFSDFVKTAGVDGLVNNVPVDVTGGVGTLSVSSQKKSLLEIYTMSGILYNRYRDVENLTVPMPRGVYIVKMGGMVRKVAIR